MFKMKQGKKVLVLIISLVLMAGCISASYAGAAVTERPDIRIYIDGVRGTYSNYPIIVNGRTLLPLRELLTNLGVTNDDEHIVWNGKENSVTAIKDSTQIYLKVGSTSAKVNNNAVNIDAAPVNYKGSIYIPARFAGEAFDKAVVWDSLAKRIYMKDKTEYNEIKRILEDSVAKMDNLKRYKERLNFSMYITTDSGEDNGYSAKSSGFIDQENQTASGVIDLGYYKSNYCVENKKLYQKNSIDQTWTQEELSEEDYKDYFYSLELGDVLYAALKINRDDADQSIKLSGNVSLEYFQNTDKTIQPYYDESIGEITIDSTTGYITKIHMYEKYHETPEDDEPNITEYSGDYWTSDYNGNFSTELPKDRNN